MLFFLPLPYPQSRVLRPAHPQKPTSPMTSRQNSYYERLQPSKLQHAVPLRRRIQAAMLPQMEITFLQPMKLACNRILRLSLNGSRLHTAVQNVDNVSDGASPPFKGGSADWRDLHLSVRPVFPGQAFSNFRPAPPACYRAGNEAPRG